MISCEGNAVASGFYAHLRTLPHSSFFMMCDFDRFSGREDMRKRPFEFEKLSVFVAARVHTH